QVAGPGVPDVRLQNFPSTAPGAPDVTVCGPPSHCQVTVPPAAMFTVGGMKLVDPLAPTMTVALDGELDEGPTIPPPLLPLPQPATNSANQYQLARFMMYLRRGERANTAPNRRRNALPRRARSFP